MTVVSVGVVGSSVGYLKVARCDWFCQITLLEYLLEGWGGCFQRTAFSGCSCRGCCCSVGSCCCLQQSKRFVYTAKDSSWWLILLKGHFDWGGDDSVGVVMVLLEEGEKGWEVGLFCSSFTIAVEDPAAAIVEHLQEGWILPGLDSQFLVLFSVSDKLLPGCLSSFKPVQFLRPFLAEEDC